MHLFVFISSSLLSLSVGRLEVTNHSSAGDLFTASDNFTTIKLEPAERWVLSCSDENMRGEPSRQVDNGPMQDQKNLPGDAQMRRQGKKMLAWLRQELGMSSHPLPWYESSLFWGALGLGGAALITALTVPGTLWLLPVAWVFLS